MINTTITSTFDLGFAVVFDLGLLVQEVQGMRAGSVCSVWPDNREQRNGGRLACKQLRGKSSVCSDVR